MTSYAVGAGVILSAGAYLRFATRPVLTAYGLGKAVERIRQRGHRSGTKPSQAGIPRSPGIPAAAPESPASP